MGQAIVAYQHIGLHLSNSVFIPKNRSWEFDSHDHAGFDGAIVQRDKHSQRLRRYRFAPKGQKKRRDRKSCRDSCPSDPAAVPSAKGTEKVSLHCWRRLDISRQSRQAPG